MTVLLIMTFPALKHEPLILCVSLSSILHPKCFHSVDFKFHSLCEGVHWKCLVFPCPFLIFLLTNSLTLFPEIIVGTTLLKKIKKRTFQFYLFQWNFPDVPFPYQWIFFFFCWWQWCEQCQEEENFITEAVTEASISLIKLIFLDSLSSLCAGKGLLQR